MLQLRHFLVQKKQGFVNFGVRAHIELFEVLAQIVDDTSFDVAHLAIDLLREVHQVFFQLC